MHTAARLAAALVGAYCAYRIGFDHGADAQLEAIKSDHLQAQDTRPRTVNGTSTRTRTA